MEPHHRAGRDGRLAHRRRPRVVQHRRCRPTRPIPIHYDRHPDCSIPTVPATATNGTWTWASQSTCTGRYGEGWAVDWWGISTSNPPSPNFSLSNATEVTSPGTTTTGPVSATGSIGLPGSKFFHVGDNLAGEVVNATSGCTVTAGVSPACGWRSATYPSAADVPAQLCVNMYDLHFIHRRPQDR